MPASTDSGGQGQKRGRHDTPSKELVALRLVPENTVEYWKAKDPNFGSLTLAGYILGGHLEHLGRRGPIEIINLVRNQVRGTPPSRLRCSWCWLLALPRCGATASLTLRDCVAVVWWCCSRGSTT
jgi:hypothetical protein